MGILNFTTAKINEILSDSVTHFSDTVKHITAAERTAWNRKAPGGYGYGDTLQLIGHDNITENDFVAALESVFSKISNNTVKQVRITDHPTLDGGVHFGHLWRSDKNYGALIVYSYFGFEPAPIIRIKSSGVWKPWEYVNPPMSLGEEYRTTERYMGKPVYVMVVDCGVAPSKGETWIKINKEISRFISIDAVSYSSDTFQTTIPDSAESCKAVFTMSSQSPYILVKTTTDNFAVNGYRIYARIKYTKSTD